MLIMTNTRWSEQQLKGFLDTATTMKLYRRADIPNDTNNVNLIEELYVDPLPNATFVKSGIQ